MAEIDSIKPMTDAEFDEWWSKAEGPNVTIPIPPGFIGLTPQNFGRYQEEYGKCFAVAVGQVTRFNRIDDMGHPMNGSVVYFIGGGPCYVYESPAEIAEAIRKAKKEANT